MNVSKLSKDSVRERVPGNFETSPKGLRGVCGIAQPCTLHALARHNSHPQPLDATQQHSAQFSQVLCKGTASNSPEIYSVPHAHARVE